MTVPDVVGMPVSRAVSLLTDAGYQVSVRRTSPPWPVDAASQDGHVIRQQWPGPREVELLVAPEDPQRLPRRIPRHIAIICDGNGRWAKSRGLTRQEGHRAGTENVRKVVEWCRELGVEHLTFYAFSTENWRRPADEVRSLMDLIVEGARTAMDSLASSGVRVQVLGDTGGLPPAVRQTINKVAEATAGAAEMTVNLLINYGGRADIVKACRELAAAAARGRLRPEAIDELAVAGHLYTAGIPDPELVIRTAGDLRLSNFLLWQAAYSELHFSPVYWPAFSRSHLLAAIDDYSRRQRRFGGLIPEEK